MLSLGLVEEMAAHLVYKLKNQFVHQVCRVWTRLLQSHHSVQVEVGSVFLADVC